MPSWTEVVKYFQAIGGAISPSLNLDGPFLFETDNLYNIGAIGAHRPANVYIGSNLRLGGNIEFSDALTFIHREPDGSITVTPSGPTMYLRLGKLLQLEGDSGGTVSAIDVGHHSNVASEFSQINLGKSRGSIAVPLPINTGDTIGSFGWLGRINTTTFYTSATIQVSADSNWSSISAPASMVFSVTPSGVTSLAALTIDASNIRYLFQNNFYPTFAYTSLGSNREFLDVFVSGEANFRLTSLFESATSDLVFKFGPGGASVPTEYFRLKSTGGIGLSAAIVGNLLFSPDNTYSIGGSLVSRPQNVSVANEVLIGTAAGSPQVRLGVGGNRLLINTAAGANLLYVQDSVIGIGPSILFITDNASDIGATGANRPRNEYLSGGLYLQALTQGSISFVGASGLISQDNTNLFWDNTAKALTLGGNAYIKGPLPWVDPIAYGADPTGVADSALAFANAITAAGTGGHVKFPSGTFLLNSRIRPLTGQRFQGSGPGSILKHGTGLNMAVVQATAASSGITFCDFAIDGNYTLSTNAFAELTLTGLYHTAQRVKIINARSNGIDASGTGNRVLDCELIGTAAATDPGSFGVAVWADTSANTGLIVARNIIRSWHYNAMFLGGTFQVLGNYIIDNHYAIAPGGGQIAISQANAKGGVISGNYIGAPGGSQGSGIELSGTGGTALISITVDHNFIIGQTWTGIVLQGDSEYYIHNNIIKNTSNASGGPGVAIEVNANVQKFQIIGNRCYDDQGVPTQQWGVRVNIGTSDNYIITNNDLRGNVNAAGISDGGTGTNKHIFGNLPLTPGIPHTLYGGADNFSLSAVASEYFHFSGPSRNTSATEAPRQQTIDTPTTLRRFRVDIGTAPGAGASRVFTIRKGGVATAATVTIANPNTTGTWTGTVALTTADLVAVESAIGGGVPVASTFFFSVQVRETA